MADLNYKDIFGNLIAGRGIPSDLNTAIKLAEEAHEMANALKLVDVTQKNKGKR